MIKNYLILLILISLSVFASKKTDNLIIFKIIPNYEISESHIELLNTSIETNLTNLGYGIINEKIQNEALDEQKKQQNSDCYDDQCLVDTGRMLAAKKLLIIRVSKQENDKFFIKLRKIDIESGIIENSFASSKKLDFNDYEELNLIIYSLLKKVILKNTNQPIYKTKSISENERKYIKIISNPKGTNIYSNSNLNSRYRLGKTPLSISIAKDEVKKIYLVKFGYLTKEYELRYDSPDKINLILNTAPKYMLKFNTSVDYNISYTPISKEIASPKTSYFKKGQKLIYLPSGKYDVILSNKNYKTLYKTINLNKDSIIDINDEKEAFGFLGIEFLTEYRIFLNIEGIDKNHFHTGAVLDLFTFRNKSIKFDLLRVGFLTDFKTTDSLKDIRFSFMNLEINTRTNLFYSFSFGFILGDGDFLFNNKDKEVSNTEETDENVNEGDLLITPMGFKFGYKIKFLDDNLIFKFYQKTDWLMYVKGVENPQHGLALGVGTSLEYFF